MFLAGDDILQSLYDQGGSARLWYQLKLRIGFGSGDSGNLEVVGQPGTVGDGLAFTLTGGDPDQLALLSGQPVEEAFRFGNGEPAGTQTTYNDYKIMYLPFGLEKVPAESDRVDLVEGVLDWFGILGPLATDDVPRARTLLLQNAPNPFNPVTKIVFAVDQTGPARLEIFNPRGQLVRVLVDETLDVGEHTAVWDGKNASGQQAASGTYFYRLSTGERPAHPEDEPREVGGGRRLSGVGRHIETPPGGPSRSALAGSRFFVPTTGRAPRPPDFAKNVLRVGRLVVRSTPHAEERREHP